MVTSVTVYDVAIELETEMGETGALLEAIGELLITKLLDGDDDCATLELLTITTLDEVDDSATLLELTIGLDFGTDTLDSTDEVATLL